MPEYLSTVIRPKKVCTELQISSATFWRLVKDNKLKTVKISRRCTGVFRSDLNTYLESLKHPS